MARRGGILRAMGLLNHWPVPLRETWSEKARLAAAEARKRHGLKIGDIVGFSQGRGLAGTVAEVHEKGVSFDIGHGERRNHSHKTVADRLDSSVPGPLWKKYSGTDPLAIKSSLDNPKLGARPKAEAPSSGRVNRGSY